MIVCMMHVDLYFHVNGWRYNQLFVRSWHNPKLEHICEIKNIKMHSEKEKKVERLNKNNFMCYKQDGKFHSNQIVYMIVVTIKI